ncbi:acyltransferase [Microbacterium hydrothermale]|uniref:acyltransferase n=1 Tax=Microbacterium hydrothermale TaxID=857427 RepID=UPI00142E1318|nr:acyltransferase [Microbacterium hydrothermale]
MVYVKNQGQITIGDRATFRGIEARASVETGEDGSLSIGARSLINSGASIYAARSVVIGDDFRMAAFASVTDFDFHEVVPGSGAKISPVWIGDDVWLGRAAIVLPGVHIGHGSVIGAGAVVTQDVPENSVAVGVPARVVRTFEASRVRRV